MQQFKIFRALGLSFKAWFKNFIPFTLLAAVLYSPVVIWLVSYDPQDADSETLQFAYFVGPMLAIVALSTLLPPMFMYRVVQDMNGIRVSMLTSIKFGFRGVLTAICFTVITHLLQYVPWVNFILVIAATCIWFVAMPVAVAERASPIAAFTRSSQLTAGRRWGILGLCLLLWIAPAILVGIWVAPLLMPGHALESFAQVQMMMITLMVALSVLHLFTGVVQAVSYVLLREDKDGVSAQELAKIFE